MHFLSSNFNLISSNSLWDELKKKEVFIDSNFDNFYLSLLDNKNQEDFRKYVNTEVSFNPHNMFMCKSKEKLKNYYEDLFPWLEKCEKLFGFDNLKGFGKIRIYTFLAERFMPYWFIKNTKSVAIPIIFYDIRKDLN